MEEVLAKYFSGNANKDEISLVESWRTESKSNAESFFEAKSAWLISQPETAPPAHILAEILNEPQGKQVPFILKSWVKYASAAVLVLAISLLFVLNRNEEMSSGNQLLADGSQITLHEDSNIEILTFDETKREIRVTGKAHFDIERDESRPFIIHTSNAKVEVLGTSFVVDTYGSKTEVSVESGVVELSKSLSGAEEISVKLVKGEMGLVSSSNKGIIKKNNNPNYMAWKTKVISFNESSMSEVKQVIEDVYGIDVKFENPSFGDCKLTAKFNKKKTEGCDRDYSSNIRNSIFILEW